MLRDLLGRLPLACAALVLIALVCARNAALDLVSGYDSLAVMDGLMALIALGLVGWIVARWPR